MGVLSLLLACGCNHGLAGKNSSEKQDDYIQECSEQEYIDIAKKYVAQINLVTPRDRVVWFLEKFAVELHASHRSGLDCNYSAAFRASQPRPIIDLMPVDGLKPPQTLTANISPNGRICVNYRDPVNDGEAAEFSLYAWSWRLEDGLTGERMRRVFDPVCFSFNDEMSVLID